MSWVLSKLPTGAGWRLAALCVLLAAPLAAPLATHAQIERLPPLSTIEPAIEPLPETRAGPTVEPWAEPWTDPSATFPAGPSSDYFDLDAFVAANAGPRAPCEDWCWQVLPAGIIYQSYLADTKDSRLGTQVFDESDQGTLWDATLGGRAGILRFGTALSPWPQGWQLDVEGSGQVRLDPDEERDLESADFRFGVPLTYGYGPHRLKLGYYHLSSHTGDEFLVKHPGFERVNYVRDVLLLGYAYYWTDNLRVYAETGWAFYTDVSEEWEFRFGAEYAPARPTGLHGAPFAAIHTHLREEVNYSGNFVVQAGWAWRGDRTSHLFRVGFHYHNGLSNQMTFFDRFEQQIGAGMWYDF
ncbi:MAG: DUF1207 domain-containing protein [Planctomycetaceae bacterium]|nr:DUF1207 domain-containing protein [Planctomycetaceae bacterium]